MSPQRPYPPVVQDYVVTSGRELPAPDELELMAVVSPTGRQVTPELGLHREHRVLLGLCGDGRHTVADLTAASGRPASVARLLVLDLIHAGLLHVQQPVHKDVKLLERVLDGLHKLAV